MARPSVVVGHTQLGCLPSASIFWYYRTMDLLRRSVRPLELVEDVVPVDYVADALMMLLFKPELRHRRYHISAGEASSVPVREVAAAFARHAGTEALPYQVVDFATIERERGRLRDALGPGDEERLLAALRLYCQFAALPVEVFDNSRLLAEGMPAPPPFTSYLGVCAARPGGKSVYEQMADDDGGSGSRGRMLPKRGRPRRKCLRAVRRGVSLCLGSGGLRTRGLSWQASGGIVVPIRPNASGPKGRADRGQGEATSPALGHVLCNRPPRPGGARPGGPALRPPGVPYSGG